MQIPQHITMKFDPLLVHKGIPKSEYYNFRKWLRYYLHFCNKYQFPEPNPESLPHFIKKLQEKHQSATQQKQAAVALSLYYSIVRSDQEDHIESANSRKQQHIGSPVSCDASITQPKSIDAIRDDQEGVPNFTQKFNGNDHGSTLHTRRGSPAPTHRAAAPPLAIDSKKTVAYEHAKGWSSK